MLQVHNCRIHGSYRLCRRSFSTLKPSTALKTERQMNTGFKRCAFKYRPSRWLDAKTSPPLSYFAWSSPCFLVSLSHLIPAGSNGSLPFQRPGLESINFRLFQEIHGVKRSWTGGTNGRGGRIRENSTTVSVAELQEPSDLCYLQQPSKGRQGFQRADNAEQRRMDKTYPW